MENTRIISVTTRILILFLWRFTIVYSQGVEFKFVIEPTSTIANRGYSVVLQCNTNVPPTSVEWYFDGVVLSTESVNAITNSNQRRRKRFKDDRNYAFTEYSRKAGRRFRNRNRARRRRGGNDDRKKDYGKRYVRSVDARTHIDTESLGVRFTEDRLEIDHLQPKNSGSYHCVSTIPKGSIRSSTARVQIAHLSNFSSTQPKKTKAGLTAAVIPCDLLPGSIPSAVIKWRVNGRMLESFDNNQYVALPSGSLLIRNATAAAKDQFQCIASNPISSQTSTSPHISSLQLEEYQGEERLIYPQTNLAINMTAKAGERVLMVCISDDLSKFIWTRDNGDIPDSATITELGLNMTVGHESSGFYTCKLKENSSQVQYNLIVEDATCDSTTEKYFNSKMDETVTMGCASNASNPAWHWYYNGQRMLDVDGPEFKTPKSPGLGFYQCFVISSAGTCTVTFTISDTDEYNDADIEFGGSEDYFSLKEDEDNIPPVIEVAGIPSSSTSHIIRWTLTDSDVKLISIKYYKDPHGQVSRYPHKIVNIPGERRSVTIRDLDPASDYFIDMVAVSHDETRSKIIISSFRTGESENHIKPSDSPEIIQNEDGNKPRETVRAPRPPTRPRVNTISVHQVALMWRSRSNGRSPILGFKVQMKEGKGGWKDIGETKGYPYEVKGLERGKSYKFRIIAFNAVGDSKPSQASKQFPKSPKLGIFSAVQGPDYITIMWEWENGRAPPKLEGYYVYYRSSDFDDDDDYVIETYRNTAKLSYTIRGLTPGTQYDVKVQAYTDSGKATMSNVRIVELPSAPVDTNEGNSIDKDNESDPNDPARQMAHQRNMIYLISGCIVAAIMLVLLLTVFCYWRKRGAQKNEAKEKLKSKNGSLSRQSPGKKCDHKSNVNSNGHVSPHEASSTQHSRNHSPHGTRCQCSRHHSNHSSLGREGNSYSSYPVSQVGYQHWEPTGNFPDINVGQMHVIMDPRHYGIGRWVRGGEFCHIIPVDNRKTSHDGGQETERQYITPGSLMVTRTYDGNLTATTDTIIRPDHGYHSNEDDTRTGSDSQLQRSEIANPNADDDANSADAATSGIVTLHEATIDSRSSSPSNRDDEMPVEEEHQSNESAKTDTIDITNCEETSEDNDIETTPFLNADENSESVT